MFGCFFFFCTFIIATILLIIFLVFPSIHVSNVVQFPSVLCFYLLLMSVSITFLLPISLRS